MCRGNIKILILGKNGMLGSAVFRKLSACRGLSVDGTVRSDASDPLYLEAERPARIEEILANGRYDYIINCIGILKSAIMESDCDSIRRAIVVNALFPHILSQAAMKTKSCVIHISTDGVFSGTSPVPYVEDSSSDCIDFYGKTKALGECRAKNVLNIRCSIIGRDLEKVKGLLEWFLRTPDETSIDGFTDHLWNGVTTTQFAKLCEMIITNDCFTPLRDEFHVHHFCPNPTVSKYDLLCTFKEVTGRRIQIRPKASGLVSLVLGTRLTTLRGLYKEDLDWKELIHQLLADDIGCVNKI